MMSNPEMQGHDNDWYCTINGYPIHIASMCGIIPKTFRDLDSLRKIQEAVSYIPMSSEVVTNDQFIDSQINVGYEYLQEGEIAQEIIRLNQETPCFNLFPNWSLQKKLYACTFLEKAKKGFYSYALKEGTTNRYHLVASPKDPLSKDDCDSLGLQSLMEDLEGGLPNEIVIKED